MNSLRSRVGTKSVFLFFALVFFASSGGHADTWDGKVYYLMSENIVTNGSLEIRRDLPLVDVLHFDVGYLFVYMLEWQDPGYQACAGGWDFEAKKCNPHELQESLEPDLPDAIYTPAAPLLPVLAAPLYAAERLVGMPGQLVPFIANNLILAATAAVLFRLSYEIFRSKPKAFVLSLAFGVCSFAWPYQDTFFLQPIAGLLLVLAVYLACLSSKRGGLMLSALAGVAAGSVILGHTASLIFVPGLAAFFVVSNRSWKGVGPFFSGLAVVAAVQMWINHARFGDVLDFGYGPHAGLEGHAYADGLVGLIFSPGFGLLANMPLFALFPVGVYLLWKRHRALALLVGYAFAVSYAYFGTLDSPLWHGFGGWGPRYLVPVIPLLVLPLGFFLDKAAGMLARASFVALAAAGFLVNLAGVLVWYHQGYGYGWHLLRIEGVPLEQQVGFFQWVPEYAPAVLNLRALNAGYWESIMPAPGVAYWPACVPDVLAYCSFGLAGTIPVLAAVAAAGLWIGAIFWAGGPRAALALARSRFLGPETVAGTIACRSAGGADPRGYGMAVVHVPKSVGIAAGAGTSYGMAVVHVPKSSGSDVGATGSVSGFEPPAPTAPTLAATGMPDSSQDLPERRCLACGSASVRIGGANARDARGSYQGTYMEAAVSAAVKAGYDRHGVFLCRACGLLFVDPVLSDAETMDALFRGQSRPKFEGWNAEIDFKDGASVFNTAVRVPRYDQMLRPFLKGPVRVLDVGAHRGEISMHLDLAEGSGADLLQVEGGKEVHGGPGRKARMFAGMLGDLPPDYRADLILALHVLEHADDPTKFVGDLKKHMAEGGLLLVEVPLATGEAFAVASGQLFQITHDCFFTPESLRHLLETAGLEIVEACVDPNANTGNGTEPYPVIRALCWDGGTGPAVNHPDACLARTADMLFGNFSGSLAFFTDKKFKVFVYDPRHAEMARVFESASGFSGFLTSNRSLPYDNIFDSDLEGVDFIFTLHKADRDALKKNTGIDPATIQ